MGLSIDRPAALHDAYRRQGRTTHLRRDPGPGLSEKTGVEFIALVTIHHANTDHPLEVYRFLRDHLGIQFIQLIPIVERVVGMGADEAEADQPGEVVSHKSWRERQATTQFGNTVTERSVTADQYGRFLDHDLEEWVRHDVAKVYVNMFDVALASAGAGSAGPMRLCADVWDRAGAGAQRRHVLVRPLRGAGVLPGEHQRLADDRTRLIA